MERALCVSVRHLCGRYHGEEWPPSPSRLFQAMLAGAKTGRPPEAWTDQDAAAFRWLEQQPAPTIISPRIQRGGTYRLYVPNNDSDLVVRGRKSLAEIRTDKDVIPKVISEELAPLHYVWPLDPVCPAAEHVSQLARRIFCLGWGIDPATGVGRIVEGSEVAELRGERWEPVADSTTLLNVPAPGYYDDLEAAYRRWQRRLSASSVDTAAIATRYDRQPYERSDLFATRGHFCFDLVAEDSGNPVAVPWRRLMEVSAWLRHVAGNSLASCYGKQRSESFVYGHGGDPNMRVSYVPVPTIGHPHSDGSVRRAMVVWPVGMAADVPLHHLLNGASLVDSKGEARALLKATEQFKTVWPNYIRREKTWLSVTPVVLHGHNGRGRRIDQRRTERLLLEAFAKGGYPESIIEDVWIQRAPFWKGPGQAGDCNVPQQFRSLPRVHVGVRFRVEVSGPVLAGIGRHCGFGLFACDSSMG